MNKALTVQANAVKEYGGMVDKYIGDAMMAIFNAPIDLEDHEDRAILTALKIKKDNKQRHQWQKYRQHPQITLSVPVLDVALFRVL